MISTFNCEMRKFEAKNRYFRIFAPNCLRAVSPKMIVLKCYLICQVKLWSIKVIVLYLFLGWLDTLQSKQCASEHDSLKNNKIFMQYLKRSTDINLKLETKFFNEYSNLK